MPVVYTRKRLRAPPPPPPPPPSPPPPSTSPSPALPTPPRKKKRYTQLFIDAGQKDIVKTCTCGMVYVPGKDDNLHKRYHQISSNPRWSPRTNAKYLSYFSGLKFYLIDRNGSSRTVMRIDQFVSDVLGTVLSFPSNLWVSIIAVSNGLVRAFCLAERIQEARLMRSEGVPVTGSAEKAIMGVRKIWVDQHFRGRGIATRLVKEACLALVYGMVVETRLVAFSAPTADGTKFANAFCSGRVLVYDTDAQGCVKS